LPSFIRDVTVRIAGPNRSFGPSEAYSQNHFDRVGGYPASIRIRDACMGRDMMALTDRHDTTGKIIAEGASLPYRMLLNHAWSWR
jgi:hypothetical protein